MKKTNKKKLEEFIRVDHAGERGAIKIYEGQLLALKTFKKDPELLKLVEEMREHEQEHSFYEIKYCPFCGEELELEEEFKIDDDFEQEYQANN